MMLAEVLDDYNMNMDSSLKVILLDEVSLQLGSDDSALLIISVIRYIIAIRTVTHILSFL